MPSARYFLDADALSKLAHWNILALLPELLACRWEDISTIASLRFRAASSVSTPDNKLFHTHAAAAAALQCIELMSPAGAPEPELLAILSAVPQIDPGEAVLMSAAAGATNGVFITGDKRALAAFAQHPAKDVLSGRIICIEQIVKRCLQVEGREWILDNVCPNRTRDKAVSMVLGSLCDASLENLTDGLNSYINELDRLADPSLLAQL